MVSIKEDDNLPSFSAKDSASYDVSQQHRGHHTSSTQEDSFHDDEAIDIDVIIPSSKEGEVLVESVLSVLDEKDKIGRWAAIAMVINLYVGTGVVTIPASIALGGWISLLLLAFVGAIACSTGLQISNGFETTNSQSYYTFANAAGGQVAEKVTLVILTLFFISSNVFNSLIIFDTLHSTLNYFGHSNEGMKYAISISIGICLPLALTAYDILHPRGLTRIGQAGTIFVVLLVICLIGTFSKIIHSNNTNPEWDGEVSPPEYHTANLAYITGVISNVATNYAGHGGLPDIYRRMSNPKEDFRFVVYASFIFMTTMFIGLGALSYAALGDGVAKYPNVLSYLPYLWPGHSAKQEAIILLMNIILTIKVILSQPVFVDLTLEYYEGWLLLHSRNCIQRMTRQSSSNNIIASTSKRMKAAKITIYFTYFILTVLISIGVHTALAEEALMHYLPWETTIFACSEIYLFPSTFLLLILWKENKKDETRPISKRLLTWNVCIFILCWAIFANCLYFSIMYATSSPEQAVENEEEV